MGHIMRIMTRQRGTAARAAPCAAWAIADLPLIGDGLITANYHCELSLPVLIIAAHLLLIGDGLRALDDLLQLILVVRDVLVAELDQPRLIRRLRCIIIIAEINKTIRRDS